MKKALVFLLLAAAAYLVYVFVYRPNLLSNGCFGRGQAHWQFAKTSDAKLIVPKEDGEEPPYLSIAPGGEICQFFLSGLVPGQICEASFEARAKKTDARLTFRLDNHTHAIVAVTNVAWQTVKFSFPIFEYADKRSFRLVAGKSSGVDVRELSLKRTLPWAKYELTAIRGKLVTNLVVNGDFAEGTNGWGGAEENGFRPFDKRGVPTLMFTQSSNVLLTAAQKVRLKKGVPYVVSAYALMDDNRPAARIANVRCTYKDARPRNVELKFNSAARGAWVKGSTKITPTEDCEMTVNLRCEHSRGKTPGKVYFHGVKVYPAEK